ncbi:hypothetical protein [Verrucomicrobium sp. GAS474]|uniref:hypothetical protein n=1 Tax=Verrucomicrobium sp. GAS474 TaxID=1882831 RepID=UPI000B8927B4|nr:hypothetical protein [Verrucomicrobium sp. GAS474]
MGSLAAFGTLPLRADGTAVLPQSIYAPVDSSRMGPSTSPALTPDSLMPNTPVATPTPAPSPSDSTSLLKPDGKTLKDPKAKSNDSNPNSDWLAKGIKKEQDALGTDKNGQKANPYDEKKLLDPQQIAKDREKASKEGAGLGSDETADAKKTAKAADKDKDKNTAATKNTGDGLAMTNSAPGQDKGSDSSGSANSANGNGFKPLLQGLNKEVSKPLEGGGNATASAAAGSSAAIASIEPINPDMLAPVVLTGNGKGGAATASTPTFSSTSIAGTAPITSGIVPGSASFGQTAALPSANTMRTASISPSSLPPSAMPTLFTSQSFSNPIPASMPTSAISTPRPIVTPSIPTSAAPPTTAPYRSKVKDPNDFGFGH